MKAFPKITKNETPIFYEGKFAGYENIQDGMDLRDYFAAMALTTFLIKTKPTDMTGAIASECYAMADAMMKARND